MNSDLESSPPEAEMQGLGVPGIQEWSQYVKIKSLAWFTLAVVLGI